MTAGDPPSFQTIALKICEGFAKDRVAFRRAYLLVIFVLMLLGGIAVLWTGHWDGPILAGFAIVCLILSPFRPIITTFDLGRREVTIEKQGLLRSTIRRVPLGEVQGLFLEPGRRGAALWLRNGRLLKASNKPIDTIALDRCLTEIRAQLGIPDARPTPPPAGLSGNITRAANGAVIFERPSLPPLFGSALLFVSACGFGALSLFELTTLLPGAADLVETALFLVGASVTLLCAVFLVVIGLLPFSEVKRLVLDPATRQAHVILIWPIIRANEAIVFDDFVAVGVLEHHHKGRDDTYYIVPYIQLTSGRRIELLHFSKDFRAAEEMALLMHRMTGAAFRNRSDAHTAPAQHRQRDDASPKAV